MSIPPPSAAASNGLNYRPSQSSSSSRRPPRQPPPAANNVRVNPASSEVISSLLASLSSVSLPSEDPSPLIPQDATLSPSLPPSSWTSARPSARPSISHRPPSARSHQPRDPALDIPGALSPVSSRDNRIAPSSDAAEPPTIRTARPPSGLSKLTAHRSSKRIGSAQATPTGIASALSSFPSPPGSARQSKIRLDGPLPPLPKIAADRLRSRSSRKSSVAVDETPKPRGFGLQRDSLLLLRSRGKDKERDKNVEDTVAQALASTSSLPPPISRHRALSPRGAQTSAASRVTSPARSIIATMDEVDDTMPAPNVPMRARQSEDEFVIVRGAGESSRPSFQDHRSKIPSRTSSLRDRSASPPRNRMLSRRSSRQSNFQAPETVPEETFASQLIINHEILTARTNAAGSPLAPLSPMSPVTLDEENDVVRRIKQLRAAKEERQRAEPSPILQSAPTSPTAPKSPAMNGTPQFPDTTRAIKQLDQADRIEERQVYVKDDEFPARGASLTPQSAAFAFQSISIDPGHRPSTANPSSPHAVQPLSPVLSRSGSAKRWSNPDLPGRKNSLHQRQGSRGQAVAPDYPPVPEERRASFDSVKESVTDFLNSPRLSQKIRSPVDNRVISFSEVGDPKGFAVICCTGMGLTRFVTAFYDELASSLNLRLITPERPGIGDTSPYPGQRAPLFWPDDVRAICSHLSIRSFSLIAHSAGTIYALATALQMPSRIHGKIHLLAPFIPPSQLSNTGRASANNSRGGSLPRSQKLLRLVPTSFLKLTNSSYFNGGRPNTKPSPGKSKKSNDSAATSPRPSVSARAWNSSTPQVPLSAAASGRPSTDRFGSSYKVPLTPNLEEEVPMPLEGNFTADVLSAIGSRRPSTVTTRRPTTANERKTRQKRYDEELTQRVWNLATKSAKPAVDLIVCFERNQPIGYQYADISREIIIRHGTKDHRVPLDNVKWLVKTMQKAELIVLEGEGHSLMGNAGVMAQVLSEIGKEWEQSADGKDSNSFHSPTLDDSELYD